MGDVDRAERLPSGTVTFLFTDVEGSTRLWQEQPDAMRAALERHDEILRTAIAAHGGYVFTTAGDSFAAAFQDHSSAVSAASAAQEALGLEVWPAEAPISVRMGVHTGDSWERDGDYFGPTLSVAARMMNAGHGGQVLVSAATNGLLHDVPTRSLGVHRLRDLSEPQEIFELGGGDLEFPPLRTLDQVRHNLPFVADALLGREEAVEEIVTSIVDHPVATIVGVGGIGKTRLALEVAAGSTSRFADGVWLCELAPVGDEAAVAQAVADVIGTRQWPNLSMVDSVAEFCRHREMLVVLDNCEHVLDAAADLVEKVVAVAPGVRLLATSREGLGCSGEVTFPLGSLEVGGLRSASGELFLRRAAEIDSQRVWSGPDEVAIGRICARLDGIPLAIELAAARTRTLSPVEIEERLDDAFRTLRGGRRSIERHRTLQAAIEWSYDLLPEPQRVLFERMAVFAGGADLDAVEHVCASTSSEDFGDAVGDVVELLEELVAKSLVVTERTSWGRTRFRLLEPLRQFAEDRLSQRIETAVIRGRHLAYYADWAETWSADAWGAGVDLRERLDADFANVRSAVDWAIQTEETNHALRIVAAMGTAQVAWERLEVGDWAIRSLRLPGVDSHRLGPSVAGAAAGFCWWRGDVAGHITHIERGEAMSTYDPTAPQPATGRVTYTALVLGDLDAALAMADRIEPSTTEELVSAAWSRQTVVRGDDRAAALIAQLRQETNMTGSTLVGLMADGLASEYLTEHFEYEQAAKHAREAIEAARAIGANFYAHFYIMFLGLAVRGADSTATRDLELARLSLREQRDAGQQADQWLVLVGAALMLGDTKIGADVQHGMQGSQWAGSVVAGVLPTAFAGEVGPLGPTDGVGASDDVPTLSSVVDQVLAAIDKRLA